MPFVSKAQRRWMYATHPEMAAEWERHTPKDKPIPEKKGFSMNAVQALAADAVTAQFVQRLASDAQITPVLVEHLAKQAGVPVADFVKLAYQNPSDFVTALQLAAGTNTVKTAAAPGRLTAGIMDYLKKSIKPSDGANKVTQFLQRNAIGGGTQAGRAGLLAGTGAAAGGLGNSLLGGKTPPDPAMPVTGAAGVMPPTAPSSPKPSVRTDSPAAKADPMQTPAAAGMSPLQKALLGGGALGAAGLGLGAYARSKKKKEVMANDNSDAVKNILRTALAKQAAVLIKKAYVRQLVNHLDKVAASLPLEKTAAVRTMQREVLAGRPLAHAIKAAYPNLNGEQRGILAATLCKEASDAVEDKPPYKMVERRDATVKIKGGNTKPAIKQMA